MFKGALFFCMYSRYFHSHIVIAIRMDVELNSHKAVFINKNSTDKFKSSLDADIQGNIYLQKKMVPEFKLCSNFSKDTHALYNGSFDQFTVSDFI